MLDRLPRRQQADAVESPRSQPREMFVSLGERKRTPDERDLTMIGKVAREVGAAIGIRNFAIAAEVDAAKNDATSRIVDEPSSFNMHSRQTRSDHRIEADPIGDSSS